jgi:hypothetical protein
MKLSTGTEIKAYAGVLGINDKLEVFGGFDTPIEKLYANIPEGRDPDEWEQCRSKEKIEVADIMISRWQKYKEEVSRVPSGLIEKVENVVMFAPELDPDGKLKDQWLKDHPNHVAHHRSDCTSATGGMKCGGQ